MQTQVKTSGGITLVPLETRHMAKRRIFIQGEISSESASLFVDQVMLLNDESGKDCIDVFVNSPGGEVQAGLLIYDTIQTSPAPVRMFCRGSAYSIAALIFACGGHGRYILPHSRIMIHEPRFDNGIQGTLSNIQAATQELTGARKQTNQLLAKHTGKTLEEIETASSFDHYFNAEESVEFGMADRVITFQEMMGGLPDAL